MKINKIIIGLEVHVELGTDSKMFCSCKAFHFESAPNSQTCPVCLGLPGALPVPNKKAIDWTLLLGLSFGGEIQRFSHFDRKNYFYPDLPKGYQISQYEQPFILKGKVILDNGKVIRIKRIHLEEDTAKLIHQKVDGEDCTLIDFNRSGVPLVEIVSEPDLFSSDEAKEYLEKIHQMVKYLGISDADMEKGSMRLEPNVNLEIEDNDKFFYTPIAELKNINSFRFAKKAIDFEVKRQFEEFCEKRIEKASGNKQTRGWDEDKGITYPQREKEEANDYRYFPEPDIPPFEFSEEEIKNYEQQIKNYELPAVKKQRFISEYGLSDYQAKILTLEKEKAEYFENCVRKNGERGEDGRVSENEIANILINKRAPEKLSPQEFVEFIYSQKQTTAVTDDEIEKAINEAIQESPTIIESFKSGKGQALGAIVGLVKKKIGIIVPLERISKNIK